MFNILFNKFYVFCAQSSEAFKVQRPHHDTSDEFDDDNDIEILHENQVEQVVYYIALYLRLIIDSYKSYKTKSYSSSGRLLFSIVFTARTVFVLKEIFVLF